MRRRSLLLSQICAFLTVLFWSSAYVFTKTALEYYSFTALAVLRCFIASSCLAAVLALTQPQNMFRVPLSAIPVLLASGAAGFAVYILVFNKGSALLNPTTGCIIISTSPIMTAIMARFCLQEKMGFLKWLAIALAFGGILIMSLWYGDFLISEGLGWMLGAALLISIYSLLQRRLTRRFSPLQVTTYSFWAATLLLMPFFTRTLAELRSAPLSHIALAFFLGVCPSAAAYLLWTKALALSPRTSAVSNHMFLTPFLTLVLEYIVNGTWPGPATFAGGTLIMASLLLFLYASAADEDGSRR